jgi:hypothetical protein
MSPPSYSWTNDWKGNKCLQGNVVGCNWHFPVLQRLNSLNCEVTELLDIQMQKQSKATLQLRMFLSCYWTWGLPVAQNFIKNYSQPHEFCLIINNQITSRILATYQSKFWGLPTSRQIKTIPATKDQCQPHSTRSQIYKTLKWVITISWQMSRLDEILHSTKTSHQSMNYVDSISKKKLIF